MKRKLIKQGGGGYTIYLPKKWVDTKGLEATDYVELNESEGNLIIASSKSVSKTCTIDMISTSKVLLEKTLMQAYRSGFNSIILRNLSIDLQVILSVLEKVIGMEILSKEGTIIELVVYDSSANFDVEKTLLKAFQGAKMIYSEFFESDYSKNSLQNIIKLQMNYEKQCNLFRRQFVKYCEDKNSSSSGQIIIRTLNVLTNKIKYFSKEFVKNKKVPSENLLKGLKLIFDDINVLTKGIYGSSEKILELGENRFKNQDYSDKLLKKEPLFGARLYEAFTLLSHLFSTFLAMEINHDLGVSFKS